MKRARVRRVERPAALERPRDRAPSEPWSKPVPLGRDIWAWVAALAVLPLVLHSLGAPLGEPVADDLGQLHYVLFTRHPTWLDNGGSLTYWRPLAYQGYYGLLTKVILAWPAAITALHAILLALASLLLYRVARRFMPRPWAAASASFPLLAESTRALILVPIHFVDVGLIVFSALAIHEAAAARLGTAMVGLLAALLCKESAVATALLVPWVVPATARGVRGRWIAAAAAIVLGWGVVYVAVQSRVGLLLPQAMAANLGQGGSDWPRRYAWAAVGSLRAIFSLPRTPTPWEPALEAGAGLTVLAAVMCFVRNAQARARLERIAPLAAIGALWTALATAPLATVFPIWSPQRVAFNSFGLGMALNALLGAAHPTLLAVLVALRVSLFALSPGPPPSVTMLPPDTGAFVDFSQLVRLQHLLVTTRERLKGRFPRLPHGAAIVRHHVPPATSYAFGGSQAIQVWYRDSTLRWVPFDTFQHDVSLPVTTVVDWQPFGTTQIALVNPDAMRALIRASDDVARGAWGPAMIGLDQADSLQEDRAAGVFLGTVASKRSLGFVSLGRFEEAERVVRTGLREWPDNPDLRCALASVHLAAGRFGAAQADLDTLLALFPDDRRGWRAPWRKRASELREQARARARAGH